MSLVILLILCGAALLAGFFQDLVWRKYLILVLSIIALYLLQPAMPIRYLSYWLPTGTLAITILSWILTKKKEDQNWRENRIPFVVVILVVTALVLIGRYTSISSLSPQIPDFVQFIIFFCIFVVFAIIASRIPVPLISKWLIFIIIIFIMVKTPLLANYLSVFLRSINKQSVELASSIDIRWLGFSYVAFRIIHTIRDRQSGKLPDVDLTDYINYVIFFPALAAGPIDRLDHFVRSTNSPISDRMENIGDGGKRIIMGLFKKFVIADSLAIIALNNTNVLQIRSPIWMWVCLYAFALQIYFDFSGYTDIAIGMGRFLGVKLPENFSSPYLKPNLTQFWNNWHMTLTQWFRAYFFNPITRSLRSAKKVWSIPAIILFTQLSTMVLIGLWHGVTINFVLWGVWHGLGLFIHNRWANIFNIRVQNWATTTVKKMFVDGLGGVLTFNYIAIGWVFFVLPDPGTSMIVIQKLFGVG